jgi:hypothetical protein
LGVYGFYRDKKVVGVFVRFRAPLLPNFNISPMEFNYWVKRHHMIIETLKLFFGWQIILSVLGYFPLFNLIQIRF